MDIETANYIIRFFPRLMTDSERERLLYSSSILNLLADEDCRSIESYKKKVELYKDSNYNLDKLKEDGLSEETKVELCISIAKRIVDQTPEKVFFNFCPACNQLARTPYARQCKQCGYSWHKLIKANFKVVRIFELQSRPNLLFFDGDIISGVVNVGNRIDLTFFGVAIKPVIKTIDFADIISAKEATVSLGLYIDNEAEKEYLKNQTVSGIQIIIEE